MAESKTFQIIIFIKNVCTSFPKYLNITLGSFICIKNLWKKSVVDTKITLHGNASYTDCKLLPTIHPSACSSLRGSLVSLFVTYSKWKSSRSISPPCFQAFSSLRHSKRATVSFSPHARWMPVNLPNVALYDLVSGTLTVRFEVSVN